MGSNCLPGQAGQCERCGAQEGPWTRPAVMTWAPALSHVDMTLMQDTRLRAVSGQGG